MIEISNELWEQGYNWDFTPFLEQDYKGLDYVSWSACLRMLRRLHPDLTPTLLTHEGNPLFRVVTTDEVFLQSTECYKKTLSESILRSVGQINTTTVDVVHDLTRLVYKANEEINAAKVTQLLENFTQINRQLFKFIQDEFEELEEVSNSQYGYYIKPCLQSRSGDYSMSIIYPVMDNKKNSAPYPDADDLNNNQMRAFAKIIAIVTGIGYRVFTREGIDDPAEGKKGRKNHAVFKRLIERNRLISTCEQDYRTQVKQLEQFQVGDKVVDLRFKPTDYVADFGSPLVDIEREIKQLNNILAASKK